jgi:hypothetical protein
MSNERKLAHSYYTKTLQHYQNLPYDVPGKEEGLKEVMKALQRIETESTQVIAEKDS